MKRSEMVKKMTEHWLGLFPNESPENVGADPELFDQVSQNMDRLLKFLERQGMKPPVEEVCPVIFKTTHVWEKENDQP